MAVAELVNGQAPALLNAVSSVVGRGPGTAIAVLLSTAKFSLGAFCVTLRNAILDCSTNAGEKSACGVDILEAVVTGIVGIGAAVGATYIGLVSPTPRDSMATIGPVFRVDGSNVPWEEGMRTHSLYGLNRTYENPAIIEFQLDHTEKPRKYIAYEKDDYLMTRHDTGIDIPNALLKRGASASKSVCRAYWNLAITTDSLATGEYQTLPTYNELLQISSSIFDYYASNDVDSGCVDFGLNAGNGGAQFSLGASCDVDDPYPHNCAGVDYDIPLISTGI